MSEFVTVAQGAGGGILAGGLAWFLFWKSNQRNEKLVDDRIAALEKAADACERDRSELHNQFHSFQTNLISKHGEVMQEVLTVLKTLKE